MPAMKRLTLAFMVLALSAGTAAAQDRSVADPVHDPLTMDRFTPVSTFNFDLGYEVLDDNVLFLDQIFALTAAGHFVSDSGAGGYAVIPLSFISTDPPGADGESDAILGNIEVGGLYAMPLGRDADLIMHGGVALPTANDESPFEGELDLYQPYASVPRMGDLVDRWPNSTWLRLGVSPMGRASMFFWRADVGIDLMLDDDDDTASDIAPVLHVNVGAGVDLGGVDLMAELVTAITSDDDDTPAVDEGDSATTLAFGGRFGRGNVQPGLALLLPIDLDSYEALDMAIIASIAARMP
jgi:hypothetical protein